MRTNKTAIAIIGGAALALTALLLRGMIPELLRYVRIRRM
jgi:hypothetical protein